MFAFLVNLKKKLFLQGCFPRGDTSDAVHGRQLDPAERRRVPPRLPISRPRSGTDTNRLGLLLFFRF